MDIYRKIYYQTILIIYSNRSVTAPLEAELTKDEYFAKTPFLYFVLKSDSFLTLSFISFLLISKLII